MSRTTVRRLLHRDEPPRYRRPAVHMADYTPEEERNLRMLARALVATARQMLEEEEANQVSGLEIETAGQRHEVEKLTSARMKTDQRWGETAGQEPELSLPFL